VLEGEQPAQNPDAPGPRCLMPQLRILPAPAVFSTGSLSTSAWLVDGCPSETEKKTLRWTLKEGLLSPVFAPRHGAGPKRAGLLPSIKAKVPGMSCQPLARPRTPASVDARRLRNRR
jgi:glycolate oxidase iron-sulfur subunit